MGKIVIFGAGNIGRSLVGHLFSRAGYEVVFVDVVDKIINSLNERRRYRIEVKDVRPQTIWVENVRAVNSKDAEKVACEIASADIIATAVGVDNLQHIYGSISKGLVKRYKLNKDPIDIIICENVRNASNLFKEGLSKLLPEDYPLCSIVGLVETSIGKMVPIMTEQQMREDPLLVHAEAYNRIIADRKGFKREVPRVEGLVAKDNMAAYVDQKLFVHNMGHAVTAYLGYITDPEMKYIWEAMSNNHVWKAVEKAMWESGKALILEYPVEFNQENMKEYIDDLIRRFNNKTLGDTIYRVGRDLPRKLSRNDRLIGALLLDTKYSIPMPFTTIGTAAAMLFQAKDETGKLYPRDEVFAKEIYARGIDYVLKDICGLDLEREKNMVDYVKKTYGLIVENPQNWFRLVNEVNNYDS
jgi:mannitol-1-phosphate 5-dehydrogenase